MLINWPAWYLLGFDHLRGGPRMFRFDRFRAASLEEGCPFHGRAREHADKLQCHAHVAVESV